MGQEVDKKEMGHAIIDGYSYMIKALPLDSLPDKKGKIKTRNSNKILKSIAENYSHYNNAGVFLWEAEDYSGAYDAWNIYVNLPQDSRMGKTGLIADADSVVSQIIFNQALALWQLDDLNQALDAFEKAYNKGYQKKNLFDYAISVATQLQKGDIASKYAKIAYPIYGNEDPVYLQVIVNDYLEKKDFANAKEFLNGLLATNPTSAQYNDLMGVLLENEGSQEDALNMYRKAVELNPQMAIARFHLGNLLYNKAYAIDNEASSKSQAEYEKIRSEQTEPLLREAAAQLEEAFKLDEQNMGDALKHLKNIYYILGDEENLNRVNLM
jgi:tetratricopeptide (TPR) repeat protein